MIVVDSNVLVARVLNTPLSDYAIRVERLDPCWRVPTLWRYELQNILATQIKAGYMTSSEALTHFDFLDSALHDCQKEPDSKHVLRLVEQYHITAYDANFVALALGLDCPLVTQDAELLRKFPGTAMMMQDFVK